ncbi:MAG: hypothetical protein WC678_01765 [Parcubacteria group bacterium]|jgi:hypothetical protein
MKNSWKISFDELVLRAMGVFVIGSIFFLLHWTARSEKIATWEQVCVVNHIDKTSTTIEQTGTEAQTKTQAYVSFVCEMGPIREKEIFTQFFEKSIPSVGDKFLCRFEAWDKIDAGSGMGPGPITKHTEIILKGCKPWKGERP